VSEHAHHDALAPQYLLGVGSPRFKCCGEMHIEHMPENNSQQLSPAHLSVMCEAHKVTICLTFETFYRTILLHSPFIRRCSCAWKCHDSNAAANER
jgi:hypothetical protein